MLMCYTINFLRKFKLLILFSICIIFICADNLKQIHFNVGTTFIYNEPVDVVYTWVNGSDPKFIQNLQRYLEINSTIIQDYSAQRFDDKYELKFSLRSLEKYAPWIHHVYIVTNGQIPYWLDLDYEKVTIISHKEIFNDSHDLPSFSSPAIESHLHRIPGLSKRFIYFNDDIFVGAPIYVDDFVSETRGFLIYLTWPLPMCSIDCPWVYVGDGQCDTSCYNVLCQFDGNDCQEINKPWENINFMHSGENVYHNLVLPHHEHTASHNSSTISSQRSSVDIPKVLNNPKIGIEVETTQNPERLLHGAANVTKIIVQHNKNIIWFNKLRRKKRSAFLNRVKYANLSIDFDILRDAINIDTYGASLQHTNRIFNLAFGFKARYVPAHAPIMIDKQIMTDLQHRFSTEIKKTSGNRIRSEDDIQYGLSYYYYLMNEKKVFSAAEIFDRFDTDKSGTWSDREIRTVLTKIYELPLSYGAVDHFENILVNCSRLQKFPKLKLPEFERYIDSKLPTVSRDLAINCPVLSTILKQHFGSKSKYKYEVVHNSQATHVNFKMLNSNITDVVGHLDEVRRYTRKFVCLNDNLDSSKITENDLIRSLLYDFYVSLFPMPSKFELPIDLRNRFFYTDELNRWKIYRFKIKMCSYVLFAFAGSLIYCNLFKRRLLYRLINKIFH